MRAGMSITPAAAARPRMPFDTERAGWLTAACLLSIVCGVITGAAPMAMVGIAGLAVSTAAWLNTPSLVLVAALLARASLDVPPFFTPGTQNFDSALNAAVALGGGIALLMRMKRIPSPWITIPFCGMLGLAVVTVPLGGSLRVGLWLSLLALLVIFLFAQQVVRDQEMLKRIAWVTLASAIVPVITAFVQIATGTFAVRIGGFSSVRGTFDFANGFGFYLLFMLTLAIVVFIETRSLWARWILLVGITAGSIAFFLTYTRSAWIAAIAVLVGLGLLHYRRAGVFFAVAAVAAVVAFPAITNTIENRFADLSSTSVSHNTNSWNWRLDNWGRMFHYAVDKPLTGHGLGSYPGLTLKEFGASDSSFADTSTPGTPTGIAAHNDYLSLAVELGFIGPLLWATVLIALAVLMWRCRRAARWLRPYAIAMFLLCVTIVVLSAGDNIQSYGGVMYYVFAMAGAVSGAAIGERSRRRASAE